MVHRDSSRWPMAAWRPVFFWPRRAGRFSPRRGLRRPSSSPTRAWPLRTASKPAPARNMSSPNIFPCAPIFSSFADPKSAANAQHQFLAARYPYRRECSWPWRRESNAAANRQRSCSAGAGRHAVRRQLSTLKFRVFDLSRPRLHFQPQNE